MCLWNTDTPDGNEVYKRQNLNALYFEQNTLSPLGSFMM